VKLAAAAEGSAGFLHPSSLFGVSHAAPPRRSNTVQRFALKLPVLSIAEEEILPNAAPTAIDKRDNV